jgi:hypothetical protein
MSKLKSLLLQSRKISALPKKIVNQLWHARSLPSNHVVEDIFLVSYPKSGNTWLRFLIANAIKVHYQIEQEVNFFTILGIIPSPRGRTDLKSTGPFGRTDLPRIIKSHSAYNPYFYRVILLVRDPRDVMVSYYNYLKGLKQISENVNLSQLIRHPKHGIESWVKHSESWYYHNYEGRQIVKIFRYEDFLSAPQVQLAAVMECLGVKMDEINLEKAIALSSKENMKESEKKHRSTNLTNKDIPFIRQAAASKGQSLSDTDRKFIEDASRKIARNFGYQF